MKRIGLTTGKFFPMHLGHEGLIEFGAGMLDELIVLVSSPVQLIVDHPSDDNLVVKGTTLVSYLYDRTEIIRKKYANNPKIKVVYIADVIGEPAAYDQHGTAIISSAALLNALEITNKKIEDVNTIVLHIGNGASICAVKGGISVDTSMGFTPLAGILMGTRSGDIDPAIVDFICDKENKSVKEVISDLNKKSGYLGLSQLSSDSRDIWSENWKGNKQTWLTVKKHAKMIADYVAAYAVNMGRVDAICFTAGIGENASETRALVVEKIKALGVKLDHVENAKKGIEKIISTKDSKITVLSIPTNEEVMIARDTLRLIK